MTSSTDPDLTPFLDRLAAGEDLATVQLDADLAGCGGRFAVARSAYHQPHPWSVGTMNRDRSRQHAAQRSAQLVTEKESTR